MASYGLSLDAAIWHFPISAAECLLPVYVERKTGQTQGPTSQQDSIVAARARCRAWLKEQFEIVSEPVEWVLSH